MGHAQPLARLSRAAYLEWEARQPSRNEYIASEVFAMVGSRRGHNLVAMNIAFALRRHFQGSPCQVFVSDMKLSIEAANAFFYPDVVVTCDPRDAGEEDRFIAYPKLIVEVVSESTIAFDLGVKLDAYRALETLFEYAIVDPVRRSAHVYRRSDDQRWFVHDVPRGGALQLESFDLRIAHAELFAGVTQPVSGAS